MTRRFEHQPAPAAGLGARIGLLCLLLATGAVESRDPPSVPDLPHTDGGALSAPPSAPGLLDWPRLLAESGRACDGPCVTPFGQVLGVADGAEARSNCVSNCLRLQRRFLDLASGGVSIPDAAPAAGSAYVGLTYQCVGFARLWWMKNRGLTFGDVDIAADILSLTEGQDLKTGASVPLGRSLNGTARRTPERGDLLIYDADPEDPEWRAGHVAVIVAVDREQGLVALAEENYDNRPWQDPSAYARRIPLFEVQGRFTLLDVAPDRRSNPNGGRIAGWVYPLP